MDFQSETKDRTDPVDMSFTEIPFADKTNVHGPGAQAQWAVGGPFFAAVEKRKETLSLVKMETLTSQVGEHILMIGVQLVGFFSQAGILL